MIYQRKQLQTCLFNNSTDTPASVQLDFRLAFNPLVTLLKTKVHEARLGIPIFFRHEFNVRFPVRRHINGGRNKSRKGAASKTRQTLCAKAQCSKIWLFVPYLLEAVKSSAEKGNIERSRYVFNLLWL
jgi:hypothetical protein